jgi:hypothetical protein
MRYFEKVYVSNDGLLAEANEHADDWNLISVTLRGGALYAIYEKRGGW